MAFEIGKLTGTIEASRGGLSGSTADAIVDLVLARLAERERVAAQARSDTKVTAGVAAEQEDAA